MTPLSSLSLSGSWSPPPTPIRQCLREAGIPGFSNCSFQASETRSKFERLAQAARSHAEWNGKPINMPCNEYLTANQLLFMLLEIAISFAPNPYQVIYNKAIDAIQSMMVWSWDITGTEVPPALALLTADVCIRKVMGPSGDFQDLGCLAQSEEPELCYVYLRLATLLNKAYRQGDEFFGPIMGLMECPIADFRDHGVIEFIEQFQIDDVCKHLLTYHVFYIRMVADMKKPYEINKRCLELYVKECQQPSIATLVRAVHKDFNTKRNPVKMCRAIMENREKFKINVKTRTSAIQLYLRCLAVLDIAEPDHGFTLLH